MIPVSRKAVFTVQTKSDLNFCSAIAANNELEISDEEIIGIVLSRQ